MRSNDTPVNWSSLLLLLLDHSGVLHLVKTYICPVLCSVSLKTLKARSCSANDFRKHSFQVIAAQTWQLGGEQGGGK